MSDTAETAGLLSDAAYDLRGQFEEPGFWDRSRTELDNWIEQAAVVLYGVSANDAQPEPGRWSDLKDFVTAERKRQQEVLDRMLAASTGETTLAMAMCVWSAYDNVFRKMAEIEAS
jgi:hypothetical protein